MNRNDLQAMLHYTNEVAKIIYVSEECRHGDCDKCGYYGICQMNELLHSLSAKAIDELGFHRDVRKAVEKKHERKAKSK